MIGFVCLFGIVASLAGLLFVVAAVGGEFGEAIQVVSLVFAAFAFALSIGYTFDEENH